MTKHQQIQFSTEGSKDTSIFRKIRTRKSTKAKVDDEQYCLAENPQTADEVILTFW
jgi:hypothetical protein